MSEGHHDTYAIVLRWNVQKQVDQAEVPAIPGYEGSGRTFEAALASPLEAIRWWHVRSGEGSSSPFSQMLIIHEQGKSEGQ